LWGDPWSEARRRLGAVHFSHEPSGGIMHDSTLIAVPVLAILFGIFLNRYDFSRLESRMDKRFDALEGKVDSKIESLRKQMQQEFKEFYRSSVQQDARIDKMENKQP
jgi:hypothetical protein